TQQPITYNNFSSDSVRSQQQTTSNSNIGNTDRFAKFSSSSTGTNNFSKNENSSNKPISNTSPYFSSANDYNPQTRDHQPTNNGNKNNSNSNGVQSARHEKIGDSFNLNSNGRNVVKSHL